MALHTSIDKPVAVGGRERILATCGILVDSMTAVDPALATCRNCQRIEERKRNHRAAKA